MVQLDEVQTFPIGLRREREQTAGKQHRRGNRYRKERQVPCQVLSIRNRGHGPRQAPLDPSFELPNPVLRDAEFAFLTVFEDTQVLRLATGCRVRLKTRNLRLSIYLVRSSK